MKQSNNGNQEQSIKNLLNKVVMPVFEKNKLFEFSEKYKKEFKVYLEKKYPNKIKEGDIKSFLQPIVSYFYPEGRGIGSILSAKEADDTKWTRILKNVKEISDTRSQIMTRNNSSSTLPDVGHKKNPSENNVQSCVGQPNDITTESQIPMWSDALNYHFSFQGFMETVREFEMFVTAYSGFLVNNQSSNNGEVKIYKYQSNNLAECQDNLAEDEKKHLIDKGCYCKDKDNIYFTADYKNEQNDSYRDGQKIKKFFKETGCKVFKIANDKEVKEHKADKADQAQREVLEKAGYYNSGNTILFTKKSLFNTSTYKKMGQGLMTRL